MQQVLLIPRSSLMNCIHYILVTGSCLITFLVGKKVISKVKSVGLSPSLLLACITSSMIHTASAASPISSLEYDGFTYDLTTTFTSYTENLGLLESQPWWGDASLANALMDLVRYDLGDYFDNYPASSETTVSALTAYDISNGFVSISYWNGTELIDCPENCPRVSDLYAYIIGSRTELVLVDLPPDSKPELVLLTLADIQASLLSTSAGIQSSLSSVSTMVNGAHSRPMSRWVAPGQKTFWVAGDWGNDNNGSRDGTTGLAELGAGYNFGSAQINFSLGKTWTDQDLVHSGDLDVDGQYVMVEGIFPVSKLNGVYATLGAYRHWADADIQRGYLNMGNPETSSSSPDSRSWGVRGRLDWENAFAVKSARFSPYVDLWYTEAKLDSYTESGGSFPARFDRREDDVTELRFGTNMALPIKETGFDFIANLEAARRFEGNAENTTGEVIGLFPFDVDGGEYDRNWLKGGVGVEGNLGKGKVSLMVSGTTEGEFMSSWVAASYQLEF